MGTWNDRPIKLFAAFNNTGFMLYGQPARGLRHDDRHVLEKFFTLARVERLR
jgi:hypothetical protein